MEQIIQSNRRSKLKVKTLFLFLSFLSTITYGNDVKSSLNASAFIRLQLGTQLKALNFGVSLFGTARYQSTAIEGGINLNLSPFIQKYGVKQNNIEGTFELFGLLGYGKNNNLLGSNIGLTNQTAVFDGKKSNNRFLGIGGVVILNKISGDLSKFENAQGGLMIRISNSRNSISITNMNDATAKPFAKSGTDKGYTARLMIKFSKIEDNELYSAGFGFDMFTPEADYGTVPRNVRNSEDGMRIVSYNTKPYDDLYHFNVFVFGSYQSDEYSFSGKIGLDHPKLGAHLQNQLHDSFGLYPRFAWPIQNKAKFYSLLEGGLLFND